MKELHYITGVENLDSMRLLGVLSHNEAARVPHVDVSMPTVQERRNRVKVPNGLFLHDYANVYFDARNPMMYYLMSNNHKNLIVLRISPSVMDLPNAVLTDGNAASAGTRFLPSPDGIIELDESLIYASSWTDPDYFAYQERKRSRCAEVLIPKRILPEYIVGCYTIGSAFAAKCKECNSAWEVEVNRNVYFR